MELKKRKTPMGVAEKQMSEMSAMAELPLQTNKALSSKANISSSQSLNRKEVLHSKRRYWIGRRTQDIIFSSIAILVLWPLVLICALLIVIDSPGASPFFVQERVGRNGKRFRFYNLRSMDLVRRLHEKLKHIRAYFCAIKTTNLHNANFRHLNGVFYGCCQLAQ